MATHTNNHILDILDRMIQGPGFQRKGNEPRPGHSPGPGRGADVKEATALYDDVISGRLVVLKPIGEKVKPK